MNQFSEFERAMLLMQFAQNEQLHAIAAILSRDTESHCERVQEKVSDAIREQCPGVAALLKRTAET